MKLAKRNKTQHPKVRRAANDSGCKINIVNVCTYPQPGQGYVVFAHAPSEFKGTGIKSITTWGAFGCYECHNWLDGNKSTPEDRQFYWLRSIERTQRRLFEQGILRVA